MKTSNNTQGRNVTFALNPYRIGWCLVVADRMNKKASHAAKKAGGCYVSLADRIGNASFEAKVNGAAVRYMTQHATTLAHARDRGLAMAEAAKRHGAKNVRVYCFTDKQYGGGRPKGAGMEMVTDFFRLKLTEKQTAEGIAL